MVRAIDIQGLISEKTLKVQYAERRKNIWAVVIGINEYPKAPQLKYAIDDAKAFYDYLLKKTQIPPENVTLLLNHEAGLGALRSTLGTQLKNKAGKEDMVILYFAGHGAIERDVLSPDGDGLGHGVFTYFLLEGLSGKADIDRDGQITVDEAYDYVSRNVPKATGQEQHPVKKGEVEGHLILGIVR